ncbi:unnamed protein product, partial [Iphiclides podalirius]
MALVSSRNRRADVTSQIASCSANSANLECLPTATRRLRRDWSEIPRAFPPAIWILEKVLVIENNGEGWTTRVNGMERLVEGALDEHVQLNGAA